MSVYLRLPVSPYLLYDISGTGIGQEFKISLCGTLDGCGFNTNQIRGFDSNDIFRLDQIVAADKFITVSAVPIPAAVWLFGSGLLGLIGVARRKKTDSLTIATLTTVATSLQH